MRRSTAARLSLVDNWVSRVPRPLTLPKRKLFHPRSAAVIDHIGQLEKAIVEPLFDARVCRSMRWIIGVAA